MILPIHWTPGDENLFAKKLLVKIGHNNLKSRGKPNNNNENDCTKSSLSQNILRCKLKLCPQK